MLVLWIIAALCLWYVIGCAGFLYWWRQDWDFTSADVGVMLSAGLLGPLSWIVGWSFHGNKDRVIWRRKNG